VGGIRPHFYCLPILKRQSHQQALQEVAVSGDSRFFLGTDSAPHDRSRKESACGCAGCYSAFAAIELYAQFFEEASALERLEDFASPLRAGFLRAAAQQRHHYPAPHPWTIPEVLHDDAEPIVPP